MRHREPDHIGAKLGLLRYAFCWFETLLSTLCLTALWFFLGTKICLRDSRIKDVLENAAFLDKHSDENFTVSLCRMIKRVVDDGFIYALLILAALLIAIVVLRWYVCRKNSLVFMKFSAASLFCGGIVTSLISIILLISGFGSDLNFANAQNKMLFEEFARSSVLILLATGFMILVLAVLCQFVAETIVKNRTKAYRRRCAEERKYFEEGL